MSKKYMQILCILISVFLTLSVTANFSTADDSKNGKIVLVENGSSYLDTIKKLGTEIIDKYNNYVLIKISKERISEYESYGMRIDELKKRTTLHVKSHTFDFKEGEPDIEPELKKKSYKKGTEGLYIVHMLGPINPEWRNTVEDKGVKVINYVPNYAYEVKMTPKQAQEIRDLFFVDWVGIYHPGYKVNPGIINNKSVNKRVMITAYCNDRIFNKINKHSNIISHSSSFNKINFLTKVKNGEKIKDIAFINSVYYLDTYSEPKLFSEKSTQIIGGGCTYIDDDDNHVTPYPLNRNIDNKYGSYFNQLGYSGSGVTIALPDTGVGIGSTSDNDAGHNDFTGRVIGGKDYSENNDWGDYFGHGTHCAGMAIGDTIDGNKLTVPYDLDNDGKTMGEYITSQSIGYDADLYPLKVWDNNDHYCGPEPNYYLIPKHSKQNANAYVLSNSWGPGGGGDTLSKYNKIDKDYDIAVRDSNDQKQGNQPMVICAAVGNFGGNQNTRSIASPANGKNVISVGASGSRNIDATELGASSDPTGVYSIADYSSKGWEEDYRIKPDIVAPGDITLSTRSSIASKSYAGIYTPSDKYQWASGTSFSTPLVAGASSAVVEWYNANYGCRPSPAMVKALLINTANDLKNIEGGNTGPIPNKGEGWGIVDISKLEHPKNDPVPFVLKDQNTLLQTGQTKKFHIGYDRDNKPLKISLVWTDKEAEPGANPTMKNNLNLKVVTPNGDTYLGNAFDSDDGGCISDNGFSLPNTGAMNIFDRDGDGYDDRNNVENVYINSDDLEPGSYTIIIEGENIPADANNDGSDNQDFALVAYNALSIPPVEITTPPVDGWETFLSDVTIEWDGGLSSENLDHFRVKIDNNDWINVGTNEQYTYTLSDGWYTVYVREYRNDHVYSTRSKSFEVDTDGGPMR